MILGALRGRLALADTAVDRNYGLELGDVVVVAAVVVVGVDVAAARDIIRACIRG